MLHSVRNRLLLACMCGLGGWGVWIAGLPLSPEPLRVLLAGAGWQCGTVSHFERVLSL